MKRVELCVTFSTFEDVETTKLTLPSVVAECVRTRSALIIHDSSVANRAAMSEFLASICGPDFIFLLQTSPISMAAARNLSLHLATELFMASYVCMLEDDHGLRPGSIDRLISAMKNYYGVIAPNGMSYGLFSGCVHCWRDLHRFEAVEQNCLRPADDSPPHVLGGANSCFRAAPTSHWHAVLRGYDPDEYMISNWQTRGINFRNYNRGFTTLYIDQGNLAFTVDRVGRGYTLPSELRRWDEDYSASDPRSLFFGKPISSAAPDGMPAAPDPES